MILQVPAEIQAFRNPKDAEELEFRITHIRTMRRERATQIMGHGRNTCIAPQREPRRGGRACRATPTNSLYTY